MTGATDSTGHVDIYIQVVWRDHDQLFELLSRKIPDIGGVTSTETFMELKMHKVSYVYSEEDARP